MLYDVVRLTDHNSNSKSTQTIFAYLNVILLLQINFRASFCNPPECHRDGNNLNCERLSLKRLPVDSYELHGVESLVLTSNQISEIEPNDSKGLPATLKKLDLSDNKLTKLQFELLDAKLENLRELVLSKNFLKKLQISSRRNHSELIHLDLSHNVIENFGIKTEFLLLQKLDLKFNRLSSLPSEAFRFLPNLFHLDVSGNPVVVIPDSSLDGLKSLEFLFINSMPLLSDVSERSLSVLHRLTFLEMRNNTRLKAIDTTEFPSMTQLRHLDLSSNSIERLNFPNDLGELKFLDISNNSLHCDCFKLRSLHVLRLHGRNKNGFDLIGFSCSDRNDSYTTLDEATEELTERCHSDLNSIHENKTFVQVGKHLLLVCPDVEYSEQVVWLTNRKELYSRNSVPDFSSTVSNRIAVLENGSLLISKVLERDGGDFVCITDQKNEFTTFTIKLDYGALTSTSNYGMLVGAATAAIFFVASAFLGAMRYLFNACSRKEKRKKKSIREILEKMSGFKTAQMDKLSAYKSAKMDQLLAFKSATIDQLYAFKTARVDKLRTYKHATVNTILQHMDRMRDHYSFQSSRIKENCFQQVDKLRETYETGCGRLKDYRCQRVEKIRENYANQVCKIREYGVERLMKLREQYKTQQQYLLKLLELIDLGNCITVIEAECLKTESVIFDADITFDLEPRPIRMPDARDCSGGEEEGMMEEEERLELEKFLEKLCSFNGYDDENIECDEDRGNGLGNDVALKDEGSGFCFEEEFVKKSKNKKRTKSSSSPPIVQSSSSHSKTVNRRSKRGRHKKYESSFDQSECTILNLDANKSERIILDLNTKQLPREIASIHEERHETNVSEQDLNSSHEDRTDPNHHCGIFLGGNCERASVIVHAREAI